MINDIFDSDTFNTFIFYYNGSRMVYRNDFIYKFTFDPIFDNFIYNELSIDFTKGLFPLKLIPNSPGLEFDNIFFNGYIL